MPFRRMTTRRWMIAAAVIAVVLTLSLHVQYVLRDAEDLAPAVLALELVLASVPAVTALVVYAAIQHDKKRSDTVGRRSRP